MGAERRRLFGHFCAYAGAYAVLFAMMVVRGADLRANPAGWYVALAIILLPTFVLVRRLVKAPRPVGESIVGLSANTAGLIGFFAIAHMQSGLVGHPGPTRFATALYFSIVTWTTLGYGDLQPIEDLQLLASFEALIGYLYLSLLVALLAKALRL